MTGFQSKLSMSVVTPVKRIFDERVLQVICIKKIIERDNELNQHTQNLRPKVCLFSIHILFQQGRGKEGERPGLFGLVWSRNLLL